MMFLPVFEALELVDNGLLDHEKAASLSETPSTASDDLPGGILSCFVASAPESHRNQNPQPRFGSCCSLPYSGSTKYDLGTPYSPTVWIDSLPIPCLQVSQCQSCWSKTRSIPSVMLFSVRGQLARILPVCTDR